MSSSGNNKPSLRGCAITLVWASCILGSLLLVGKLDIRKLQADGLRLEGETSLKSANYKVAEEKLEKALELYQAIEKEEGRIGEAATLSDLGGMYARIGDYGKALQNFQQELDMYEGWKSIKAIRRYPN